MERIIKMNSNVNINERELDWNDTISKDSSYELLPEGDYRFGVLAFERARHPGSDKLPPCNKAILTLGIKKPDGSVTEFKHNLFLHTKTEGLLCNFFTAIGLRRHGEKLTMDWNKVIGSEGYCHISVREWVTSSGEKAKSNEIKRFIEPPDAPSSEPKETYTYHRGNF